MQAVQPRKINGLFLGMLNGDSQLGSSKSRFVFVLVLLQNRRVLQDLKVSNIYHMIEFVNNTREQA